VSEPKDFSSFRFEHSGRQYSINQFLNKSDADGLVILHRGKVILEHYDNGMTSDTPHILMSVSKSLTAIVAGILFEQGKVDPGQRVVSIIPELKDSVYSDATVRHVLDMRVGLDFDEDYLATSRADRRIPQVHELESFRERSSTAAMPRAVHACRKAAESSVQVALSKSTARNKRVVLTAHGPPRFHGRAPQSRVGASGFIAILSGQNLVQLAKRAEKHFPIFKHAPARRLDLIQRRFPTAPVSHQKRRERNATNAIEIKQKSSKINESDRYSAAHNGLIAGSSPAGPTNEI